MIPSPSNATASSKLYHGQDSIKSFRVLELFKVGVLITRWSPGGPCVAN